MNGVTIKNYIIIAVSAAGGFIVEFVGGVDVVLKALIIFMAVDYLTGLAVAFVFHKSKKQKTEELPVRKDSRGSLKRYVCFFWWDLPMNLTL